KHSYESEKWRTCSARIFESGDDEAVEALTIDPASLYSAFEQVTEGRNLKTSRLIAAPGNLTPRSRKAMDESFAKVVFPPTSFTADSHSLGSGKRLRLSTRRDAGRGSLWRPLPASGSDAGRAQHRGPLLDGSPSGGQRRPPNPTLRLSP
ncbi:MAG TPA: hypothetical protein VIY29_29145, partial [Ktedonobacteraceae bacterium]